MTPELKEKLIRMGNTCNPFDNHNGLRVADVDDGSAVVEVELTQDSLNSWGTAHGGLLFTLADVACGMAAISLRREAMVTVNASVDFIAPTAGRGVVRARGRVVRCGGKLCFCAAEIRDEGDALLCRMNVTMYFTGQPLTI